MCVPCKQNRQRYTDSDFCSICSRAAPIFGDDPAPVSYLPFESHTFRKIVQIFCVHPTITKTIGREVTGFTYEELRDDEADGFKIGQSLDATAQERGLTDGLTWVIACTVRTSPRIHDDIALSSTFFVTSGLSLAVIYGCNESQKEEIIRRIGSLDFVYNHPVLLAGLIAELERNRIVQKVDRLIDDFTLRASLDLELDFNMNKTKMAIFLGLCYDSRDLINHMETEKRHLNRISAKSSKKKSFSGPGSVLNSDRKL